MRTNTLLLGTAAALMLTATATQAAMLMNAEMAEREGYGSPGSFTFRMAVTGPDTPANEGSSFNLLDALSDFARRRNAEGYANTYYSGGVNAVNSVGEARAVGGGIEKHSLARERVGTSYGTERYYNEQREDRARRDLNSMGINVK